MSVSVSVCAHVCVTYTTVQVGKLKRFPVGLRARTPSFILSVKLREIPGLWKLYPKSETMLVRRLFLAAQLAEKEAEKEQARKDAAPSEAPRARSRRSKQRAEISLVRHMNPNRKRASVWNNQYTLMNKSVKIIGGADNGIHIPLREWALPGSPFRRYVRDMRVCGVRVMPMSIAQCMRICTSI
jgi:hypothetical protein